MATIQDIIASIADGGIPALEDGGIEMGEGCGEGIPLGQPVGGNTTTWSAHPSTKAAAQAKGMNCVKGYKALHRLKSPSGATIGFPFPTARPNQLEAVDAIVAALRGVGTEPSADVMFEAGTGAGKSPIEIGVASQFDSAWLFIGRNDLVDQWENDFEQFEDIGFFKSRPRFECTEIQISGKPTDCSLGKTLCGKKRKDWATETKRCADAGIPLPKMLDHCPYALQRDIALEKRFTVMTLSLGLTMFKYLATHPGVTKRDVLIIDECSELESEIMGFFEFTATTKTIFKAISAYMPLNRLFNPRDNDAEMDFHRRWPMVKDCVYADRERKLADDVAKARMAGHSNLSDLKVNDSPYTFGEVLPYMIPNPDVKSCAVWAVEIAGFVKRRMNSLAPNEVEIKENCDRILRMTTNMMECMGAKVPYFSKVETKDGDPDYKITLSPLEARGMIQKLAEPFAKHVLYVSATTGDPAIFRAAHAYTRPLKKLYSPSTFPTANRMVYNMRAGNMSQKSIAMDGPKVMQALVAIATNRNDNDVRFNHISQRGIIHTYSNAITKMVEDTLKNAGLGDRIVLLQGSGYARENAMNLFKKSVKPMILISPSAMLGLSLNDDMGRWQVIVKTPYAYLGDPSVKHRMDNIPGWYDWQTAKDLIQTFGRIVRSETDWGSTYILDDAFTRFYNGNHELFPDYIKQALWSKQTA